MALQKRSAAMDLMPPPPSPKRIKRPHKVISEEAYCAALDYIIRRDFFPSLMEAQTQDEYLEALKSGDKEWMDEAGRRVQQAMTPLPSGMRRRTSKGPSPRGAVGVAGSTPTTQTGATPRTQTRKNPSAADEVDLDLSLGDFQARYISEDNESFAGIVDKENAKRREKYAWIWNKNQIASKQMVAQAAVRQAKATRMITARANVEASDGRAVAVRDEPQDSSRDDRPALLDAATKPRDPRNGLMFMPDDLETKHPEFKSRAMMAEETSRAGAKSVVFANTRLPLDAPGGEQAGDMIPSSPSLSAIDAAIMGHMHPGLRRGGAYADSTAPESTVDGGETPRVNGYAYVDAEPTQAELDAVEARKKRTPREPAQVDHDAILKSIKQSHGNDGEDDGAPSGPNPFTMTPSSKREQLHHALVAKSSESKRRSNPSGAATPVARNERLTALKALGRTPTPKFASSPKPGATKRGAAAGALTPAAKALYERVGLTPKGAMGSFGVERKRSGKGHWTPTPLRAKKPA